MAGTHCKWAVSSTAASNGRNTLKWTPAGRNPALEGGFERSGFIRTRRTERSAPRANRKLLIEGATLRYKRRETLAMENSEPQSTGRTADRKKLYRIDAAVRRSYRTKSLTAGSCCAGRWFPPAKHEANTVDHRQTSPGAWRSSTVQRRGQEKAQLIINMVPAIPPALSYQQTGHLAQTHAAERQTLK